eukprot:755381-Hanusia_phi.AAC.7
MQGSGHHCTTLAGNSVTGRLPSIENDTLNEQEGVTTTGTNKDGQIHQHQHRMLQHAPASPDSPAAASDLSAVIIVSIISTITTTILAQPPPRQPILYAIPSRSSLFTLTGLTPLEVAQHHKVPCGSSLS